MSYGELCAQLSRRQYQRPFLVLNALFLLMTFSGKYAIGFYAVEVFRAASDSVDEYASAIVVGELLKKLECPVKFLSCFEIYTLSREINFSN